MFIVYFFLHNKPQAKTQSISWYSCEFYFSRHHPLTHGFGLENLFFGLFKIQRPKNRPVGNSVHRVTRERRAAAEIPFSNKSSSGFLWPLRAARCRTRLERGKGRGGGVGGDLSIPGFLGNKPRPVNWVRNKGYTQREQRWKSQRIKNHRLGYRFSYRISNPYPGVLLSFWNWQKSRGFWFADFFLKLLKSIGWYGFSYGFLVVLNLFHQNISKTNKEKSHG